MARNIVVDGSNIATEGRDAPSLAQLREAVAALTKEYPSARISVVVDATFGHRIAKRDVAEFNRAIESNEIVSPPAGAVGRGDAFILAIAEKVGGSVLSNDSFQEFHVRHKWLFESGRLIGGKPVPHVGWIFVERTPVRGATSARASRGARTAEKPAASSVKSASVPRSSPARSAAATRTSSVKETSGRAATASGRNTPVNEVLPYLTFVEKHPIGSRVRAVVSAYAANGVSVSIGDIHGYVPIRALASPPPRSARDVFRIGDQSHFIITGYSASRRSVDLAVPGVVSIPSGSIGKSGTSTSTREKKPPKVAESTPRAGKSSLKKPSARKTPAKKIASKAPAKKAMAKKSSVTKPLAQKTAAKKSATKKSAAKKNAPARHSQTKKRAGVTTKATKKSTVARTPKTGRSGSRGPTSRRH